MTEQDYCGCCGRATGGPWCLGCRTHISPRQTLPLWDRTYFAQTGLDCPLQVGGELDDARTYEWLRNRDDWFEPTLGELADEPGGAT